jgi:hypothetical protein
MGFLVGFADLGFAERAQLGNRLATPLDDDSLALGGLTDQFRRMNSEIAN